METVVAATMEEAATVAEAAEEDKTQDEVVAPEITASATTATNTHS